MTYCCQMGLATRIYWRSASQSCGYVDASKWLTRNNILIRKSLKFRNIVNMCPSSSCVEALFASHWGLAHTIDGTKIVQRKAYHHYMATWLPEEMWNMLLCPLTCLPIDCRFMASMHLHKTCTTFGFYQSLLTNLHFMYTLVLCALQQFWWESADIHTREAGWRPSTHICKKIYALKIHKAVNTEQPKLRIKHGGSLSTSHF